jgi:adenylate kinase
MASIRSSLGEETAAARHRSARHTPQSPNALGPNNVPPPDRNLAPDALVCEIAIDRIKQPDTQAGFLFDGFPRTLVQARIFNAFLSRNEMSLDAVIEIQVDHDILLKRIMKRASDAIDRGEQPRSDDNPVAFETRMREYRELTAPLSEFYAELGVLKTVDGMKSPDGVWRDIQRVLEPRRTAHDLRVPC